MHFLRMVGLFAVGLTGGFYVGQNYEVPKVKDLIEKYAPSSANESKESDTKN